MLLAPVFILIRRTYIENLIQLGLESCRGCLE